MRTDSSENASVHVVRTRAKGVTPRHRVKWNKQSSIPFSIPFSLHPLMWLAFVWKYTKTSPTCSLNLWKFAVDEHEVGANNDTNLKSTSAPRFSWTRAEQRRCIGSLINKKNIFTKDFKQNREIEHFMTYVFAREAESFFVTVESSFWHGVSTLCISACLIGSVSTNRLSKERFKVAALIKLSSCRITKKKKGHINSLQNFH